MAATDTNVNLEEMLAKMASKGFEEKAGFKLPTNAAAFKDFIIGGGAAKLSENLAPRVASTAEKIALSSGKDAAQAANVGRLAENVWRSGIPLIPVLYEAGVKYKESIGNYLSVGTRFSTVLKAQGKSDNFYNAINSDLEVLKNERRRLADIITHDSKSGVVHAASTLPAHIGTHLDKMIADVEEEVNENVTKKKKSKSKNPKNQISEKAQEIRRDSARKINQKFDEALDFLSDEDGKYNTLANVTTATFTGLKGLEELDSPTGRVKFLQNLKDTYFSNFIAGSASGIRKLLSEKLALKSDKEVKQPNAAVMITALAEHLENNPSPIDLNLPGCSRKGCTLEEYILDIFDQHQKDSGRKEIPRRMEGRLKEAATAISEAICDPHRMMHADALMLIVDKKHGIAKFDKGEMSEVLSGEELGNYMAKLQQKPAISRVRTVSATKQYRHHQATPEHFRESWDNLTQEEKFVWSTFLSNEILADMGVSKQERQAMRHHENEYWQDIIEEVSREMSRFSHSELKTIGLNDAQVSQLTEALQGMRRSRGAYVQKHRAELTELVTDAATLMDNQRQGFIKEIINRTKERRSYKDIVKEKQVDRPLAEQVASGRDDNLDGYRR